LNADRQNTLPTRYGCLDGPPVIDGDDQQTRDVTYVANMMDTTRTLLTSDAANSNVVNVRSSKNAGAETVDGLLALNSGERSPQRTRTAIMNTIILFHA
jgi:UDP-glucose 4-epimerase